MKLLAIILLFTPALAFATPVTDECGCECWTSCETSKEWVDTSTVDVVTTSHTEKRVWKVPYKDPQPAKPVEPILYMCNYLAQGGESDSYYLGDDGQSVYRADGSLASLCNGTFKQPDFREDNHNNYKLTTIYDSKTFHNGSGYWLSTEVCTEDCKCPEVPEPSTLLLFGSGIMVGVSFKVARKRQCQT